MYHFDELVYVLLTRRSEQEDGFYNGLLVTQHDVLRELAIHQSRLESILETKRFKLEIIKNKFPELYLRLKQPINARLLSISTGNLSVSGSSLFFCS